MQIDLINIENHTAVCNLYTGDRCVRIIMTEADADALKRDGFFIRGQHREDSAGVINTTAEYHQIKYENGQRELV
jgi:hypothetical protein